MIQIDFEEPETFKTPDGERWVINPISRKDLKKLNKFVDLNDKMVKLKNDGNIAESNRLIYGSDEDNEDEETLLKIADEVIDLSIKNVKSGEKFPERYRRQITKTIELCMLVVKASTGKPINQVKPSPIKSKGRSKKKG